MDNPKPDISSFQHAALCLAEAASSLSVAAQAMAVAADAFCAIIPEYHWTGSVPDEAHVQTDQNEDKPSHKGEPAHSGLEDTSGAEAEAVQRLSARGDEDERDLASLGDNDYYMSDHDEDYVYALLQRQQEEMIRQKDQLGPEGFASESRASSRVHRSTPVPTLPAIHVSNAGSPYCRTRILVQSEADILTKVCALSQRFSKLLCYMQYPMRSLTLYQNIIKDVTRVVVYLITPQSPDWILSTFDRQDKAIILFHETFDVKLSLKSTDDICVIHVGWPCDADRYKAQLSFQDTSNSVLVTRWQDQSMYPACAEIIRYTKPWPDQDILSPKAATDLNLRLQNSLLRVDHHVKEKAYIDWIECHNKGGQRSVSSWTPSTLIKHANDYLLGMFQHEPQQLDSISNTGRTQQIPQVSSQFVKQQGLKQAVKEGILAVASGDSALDRVLEPLGDQPKSISTQKSSKKQMGASSGSATTSSLSRLQKYSYFLRDEFDMLPVACALVELYDKVIFYTICSSSSTAFFRRLILGTTTMEVINLNAATPTETDRVIGEFNSKKRAVLVLPEDIKLENITLPPQSSCIMHVGWPSLHSNYLSQTGRYATSTAILVACMLDVDAFPSGLELLKQLVPYPNRAEFEATSLPSVRTTIGLLLEKETAKTKEKLYKEWIDVHGPNGRRQVVSWTPVVLALRANDYLLNALKYTVAPSTVAPHGALPALKAGFIEAHGLQQAAEARILNVVTPQSAETDKYVPSASINSPALDHAQTFPSTSRSRDMRPPDLKTLQPKHFSSISREYLVHGAQFNIIPLICRLSKHGERKNTICFVREVSVYQVLSPLISELAEKPVFVVMSSSVDMISNIQEALVSSQGCIVFFSSIAQLFGQLQEQTGFTQSIHVGRVSSASLYQGHITLQGLSHSYILFTSSEVSASSQTTIDPLKAIGVREYVRPGKGLTVFNDKWKQQLASAPLKTLRRGYMEWIICYYSGSHKVTHWTAVDVVTHANKFAEDVLLRGAGHGGPNNDTFVGGPLSVTSGFAKQWKLQPAVSAKLLRVE